jgi:hypothetical protein
MTIGELKDRFLALISPGAEGPAQPELAVLERERERQSKDAAEARERIDALMEELPFATIGDPERAAAIQRELDEQRKILERAERTCAALDRAIAQAREVEADAERERARTWRSIYGQRDNVMQAMEEMQQHIDLAAQAALRGVEAYQFTLEIFDRFDPLTSRADRPLINLAHLINCRFRAKTEGRLGINQTRLSAAEILAADSDQFFADTVRDQIDATIEGKEHVSNGRITE